MQSYIVLMQRFPEFGHNTLQFVCVLSCDRLGGQFADSPFERHVYWQQFGHGSKVSQFGDLFDTLRTVFALTRRPLPRTLQDFRRPFYIGTWLAGSPTFFL